MILRRFSDMQTDGDMYGRLEQCLACVREQTDFVPQAALVLGSGLGDYADHIRAEAVIDYHSIKGFPVSTVAGHAGRFVLGWVGDVRIVCMQGRVHYYEGYDMQDVVLSIRLMRMMGADILLLTNAAGGIGQGLSAGDFMLIKDQISSFVPSPLIGANNLKLGERFPDMSEIYSKKLRRIIKKTAAGLDIDLKEGVYIQMQGPNYESPAEIAMCRTLGADAVGMSTACEAIAARHAGFRIAGISCISNMAAGISPVPLSHEEVQKTADEAAPKFQALVTESLLNICRECYPGKSTKAEREK